jgi:hypothetical protein
MNIEKEALDFPVQESIVDDIYEWAARAAILVGAELRRASDAGLPMTTELVGSAQEAARWLVTGLLEHGRMVGEDHRELLRACRDRLQADEDLEQRVRAETRAAALAEEDRRVWCEAYAHYTANSGMGSSGAVEYANAELNRYREARAAWDARKEKG